MGGRLLLLALLPIAIGLPMEHPSESENFIQGFSGTFAEGLPTNEFRGPLSELSRSKRGVSEHIASMLSEPYEGPQPSNIESLFQRNSLVRPVRQSLSSDSSRRFPEPFSPSTTFMDNFVRPPVRPTVRKPVPQRPRPSFQQPIQRPPKAQPTRQTVQQVERRPEIRPQQIFSPVSRFPSFSEAQEEHKRTNDEKNRHVSNVDSFFESARIRERRDVTSKQGIASQIDSIISSPFDGTVPSSIESLYSRNTNNRVARKISDKEQPSSLKLISSIDTSNNHQSLSFPFRIPNFFNNLGIKRSSLGAEDRQDVSGGLDAILSTPYTGIRPTSIEGLFFRDRKVRKRNPQPFIEPTPQQNSNFQNQQTKNRNPQPFITPNSQQNTHSQNQQIKKRNPQPFTTHNFQQNTHSQNQQIKIRNPQSFVRPTPQQTSISQNQHQNVGQIIVHFDSQPHSGFQSPPKRQTILNPQVQSQPQLQNNPHNKLIPLSEIQSVTSLEPNTVIHSVGQSNTHNPIRPSPPQSHSGFRPSRSSAQFKQPLANNDQQFVSNQFSSSSYQLIYPSSHVNVEHGRKKRDTSLNNGEIIIDFNHSGSDFYPAVHPPYLNGNRNKGKPIYQFEREFVKNHSPYHPEEQESFFLQNIEEVNQSTRNTPFYIGSRPYVRERVRQPPRYGPSQHPRFAPRHRTRFGSGRLQIPRTKNPISLSPAFKPGPSPPAHILPPTSIRKPRQIVQENKRTPRVNRQEDIPVNRRSVQHIGNPLSDGKT